MAKTELIGPTEAPATAVATPTVKNAYLALLGKLGGKIAMIQTNPAARATFEELDLLAGYADKLA